VKKVKESRERIEAKRLELLIMSTKHQQLVDTISQLEAAVEQKKREYERVSVASHHIHCLAICLSTQCCISYINRMWRQINCCLTNRVPEL